MWARTGGKGLIREVGFELCFEENVLVQIGGENKSLLVCERAKQKYQERMSLTYF